MSCQTFRYHLCWLLFNQRIFLEVSLVGIWYRWNLYKSILLSILPTYMACHLETSLGFSILVLKLCFLYTLEGLNLSVNSMVGVFPVIVAFCYFAVVWTCAFNLSLLCCDLIWSATLNMQSIKETILRYVRVRRFNEPYWSYTGTGSRNVLKQPSRQMCASTSANPDEIMHRVIALVKKFDKTDAQKVINRRSLCHFPWSNLITFFFFLRVCCFVGCLKWARNFMCVIWLPGHWNSWFPKRSEPGQFRQGGACHGFWGRVLHWNPWRESR